jgi:hypothetical protein
MITAVPARDASLASLKTLHPACTAEGGGAPTPDIA